VQLFGLFLCRADALTRLVVGREQLGQEATELTASSITSSLALASAAMRRP